MTLLPHLAARVFNTPLLIARTKLDVILAVLGTRVGLPESLAGPVPVPTPRASPLDSGPPGIAVIPIHGTLVRRTGGMDALSGLTSYDAVGADLDAALADARVLGILLDVDSPGGEAAGVFDLADRIAAARSEKPIWALVNGEGFSAAYALASAASRIVLTRTAGVGSIGVIALHVDQSVKDAADGYRYTAIYAGERKNDFSPHEPLSGDARTTIQTEVNRLHELFVDTVAGHRRLEPAAVRATQARLFFGDDAVHAGLADAVGSFTDAVEALSRLTAPLLSLPLPKEKSTMTAVTSPDPILESGTPQLSAADVTAAAKLARADAENIADLCLLAGHPERTASYLAQGLDANAVRKALLAEKAESPEIVTRIAPQPVTSAASLDDNPLMKAAQARAANARKEK
jgi:signal peptide peptidase SppA